MENTGTNRRWTVIALLFAVFLAAMEATAVATVMPTIIGDLGGINQYAWVFTAYMLTATVTVPIYGKLSDLYGRKPILQLGILLFLLGSLLSANAWSMKSLILFRALQGLGAGAIQPIGITITGDIFKIEERAKVTAIFGTVWGLAGVFGPIIGGFIVEILGWPWIFYVNIPFGIISAIIIQISLKEQLEPKKVSIDFLGAMLLICTITSLLLVVNGSEGAIYLAPFSIICFLAFLMIEQRSKEPIVPLDMFANPVISTASLVSVMLGGAMLSLVSFLPLHVEGVRQYSIFYAGLSIIPMGIGWPLASGYSARLLPKLGFRVLLRLGLTLTVLGSSIIAITCVSRLPFGFIMFGMGIFGLGMGFSNIPLLFSVQSSVGWNRRGSATASTLFFRTIGGTVSVGVMGGILSKSLLIDPDLPPGIANAIIGPGHGKGIPKALAERLASNLELGLNKIFLCCFGIAIIALVFGLFFPEFKGINEDEKIENV
ncbi:MAG: DHA2 family efflux MFS transporter permease subunit [Oligoflexia bacterium]|nr:DHA2 family efflux MFS transporter permease subunit [Oligoflexia bacterium]